MTRKHLSNETDWLSVARHVHRPLPDFTMDANGNLSVCEETEKIDVGIYRDARAYYWSERGECPTCRDGTKPSIMPGGWFECKQCKWRD